jgi:hypothetical protein
MRICRNAFHRVSLPLREILLISSPPIISASRRDSQMTDRTQSSESPEQRLRWACRLVAIRIGRPARPYGGDGPMSDRMTAEFSAELSGPGYFRGTSTVRLAAFDLVRFHRELGGVVAGRQPHATLGSLGDEVGLTVEGEADPEGKAGGARLSGFIGAGLSSAVSFNDIEVDHPSLLRSYVALDALAGDLVGYAVLSPPPAPSAAPPDGSVPPPDGPVAPPDGPAPPPPAARPPPVRRAERARRRS